MPELEDTLPGQTPVDPDDLKDLVPGHIRLVSELNEYESWNIDSAVKKYLLGSRRYDLSDPEVLKRIHRDMLGETWKWAGRYRQSDKNLGVHWPLIPEEVKKVCDDLRYWKANKSFSPAEMAIRFHHRLVVIHPFPNGNGRHARLVADILAKDGTGKPLAWGSGNLFRKGNLRKEYLSALKKADQGDFGSLIEFAQNCPPIQGFSQPS